jgi:hypothetical protein
MILAVRVDKIETRADRMDMVRVNVRVARVATIRADHRVARADTDRTIVQISLQELRLNL